MAKLANSRTKSGYTRSNSPADKPRGRAGAATMSSTAAAAISDVSKPTANVTTNPHRLNRPKSQSIRGGHDAIAQMAAPGGTAVGVDTGEAKSRPGPAQRGQGNDELTAPDIRHWDDCGGSDAAYTRFLLHHLSQPDALLRHMWATAAGARS